MNRAERRRQVRTNAGAVAKARAAAEHWYAVAKADPTHEHIVFANTYMALAVSVGAIKAADAKHVDEPTA